MSTLGSHHIHRFFPMTLGALFLGIAGMGGPAVAQCTDDWLPGEGHPGVTGDLPVWAATSWDPDGVGPREPLLVVGGGFTGAGNHATFGIAAWDGQEWRPLGGPGPSGIPGANGQVMALAIFNGDLIAAGSFTDMGGIPANRIARWDGEQWHPLGSGLNIHMVRALAVYNGDLYVGGFFDQAGGVPARGIARWNGKAWSAVGGGLNIAPGSGIPAVLSMTVFEDNLIVGGGFTSAGGTLVRHIASWNGSSWQAMNAPPGELLSTVESLAVYDGKLIAGSTVFTTTGQFIRSISRWHGTAWGPLGTGINDTPNDWVHALIEFNGELYAGGIFTSAGGVSTPFRLAKWNGIHWAAVPAGPGIPARAVRSLTRHGNDLIVGGVSTKPSGLQTSAVGQFDGDSWHYLGGGFNAIVYDCETYDGELIAGGFFNNAGNTAARGLARRDANGQWHAFGDIAGGDGYVFDFVVYDDELIASGSFTSINGVSTPHGVARWNGNSWAPFGTASIGKKIIHEGILYAVGSFGPNQSVGRWNAATQSWQPIGTLPSNAGISCITFFNGDLIAGGIGGIGADTSVWRWDFDSPGTWRPVGQHLGFNLLQTLGVYNGELLAGGYIEHGLLRFNGTEWVPLGGGLFLGNESPDEILAVFDLRIVDGELLVAGTFSYAGAQQYSPNAVTAYHVAGWNGTAWRGLGQGTDDAAVSLHEHRGQLVVSGWFTMADGSPNGHFATWGLACPAGDITQDGAVNVDDLLAVIGAWGICSNPQACEADIAPPPHGNGQVNVDDLLMVISHWG